MGSVPTPRTFVAGEIETAAYMNSLAQVLTFLQNPPRCRVYQTTGTSLANNAATVLNFDTESWDTDNMHSTTSNTNRITASTPGLYKVTGRLVLTDNTVGDRFVSIRKNGTEIGRDEGPHDAGTGNLWSGLVTDEVYLAVGDYIDLAGYQNTGAAVTSGAGTNNCMLSARWVAIS